MGNPQQDAQQAVLDACHQLLERGLLFGTGGNVSVRIASDATDIDTLAITPTSRDYRSLTRDDICVVDFERRPRAGSPKFSMETPAHIGVYQNRPDVNAVVHTHQPFASVFTLTGQSIPALFDEQVLHLGGRVELIDYAISGSDEMTDKIVAALGNRCNAYLLRNHGALVMGTSLEKAMLNAEVLEKVARVYHYALSTGRPVTALPATSEAVFTRILHEAQDRVSAPKPQPR
ncbi:MAG TPA: class II aldolase/adducin family protein [Polyangia bacterium]